MAIPIIYGVNGQPLRSKGGYGEAGASRKKRAMKGFTAESGSPILDIDQHNETLRQRSRMLYMSMPLATSAIRTIRTNVIGCGLRLKSRLNRAVLGMDSDQATDMEKHIETEFDLWAGNKRVCDATGVNDLYAMQQLALSSSKMSGDAFVLIRQGMGAPHTPYTTQLHIIEADRVSTPTPKEVRPQDIVYVDGTPLNFLHWVTEGVAENGNTIHDGVEVDASGAVVAYYICTSHPIPDAGTKGPATWARVTAYGEETGLPNILHIMDTERPDQYRGVPFLAHVIEPLLQSRRYTESELMAAVVESYYTAFVTTETPGGGMPFNETGNSISSDPDDYEMGPGTVNVLKPGEDIKFGDPKRPTSGFATFIRAIAEQVGAATEIPADLLLKSFNASYSASRAALLEAWKSFKMQREWFVSDFCRPVYEAWFSEAVALGRINAPGFFTDASTRAAWLGSEWIGPSQGSLDPVKEITAEVMAITEGITTREQATVMLNGGSWDSNVEQIAKEKERLNSIGGTDADVKLRQDTNGAIRTEVIENIMREVIRNAIQGE